MKRVLSYGAGLDSWVMLLLAAESGEHLDAVVFEDVRDRQRRDPGEWPGTYRHIEEVAAPFCAARGIPFVVIDDEAGYPVRGSRSLFAWLEERKQIPVSGPARICTRIAKVERFEKWLDASYPGERVEVLIGFEAGEETRAAKDPNAGQQHAPRPGAAERVNRFPLMEAGFCRCRCEAYARASGYPVPRKSACVFCPYGTKGDFQVLAREMPEQFARIAQLEADKPLTKAGKKLSIKGYRTLKDKQGNVTGYRSTPLPMLVKGTYRPRPKPCGVCGAPQRATKAMGCDYLEEAA